MDIVSFVLSVVFFSRGGIVSSIVSKGSSFY